MYTLELQTSLLLMKSLNKTETLIFVSVVCFLFPKAIFLTFISNGSLVICHCMQMFNFVSIWMQIILVI